jgi:hypothetical protein
MLQHPLTRTPTFVLSDGNIDTNAITNAQAYPNTCSYTNTNTSDNSARNTIRSNKLQHCLLQTPLHSNKRRQANPRLQRKWPLHWFKTRSFSHP